MFFVNSHFIKSLVKTTMTFAFFLSVGVNAREILVSKVTSKRFQKYCLLMFYKLKSQESKIEEPEVVYSLLHRLMALEEQNHTVTEAYRKQMSDRVELRVWISRMLKDKTKNSEYLDYLRRRSEEVRVEMHELTENHLLATRDFENLKADINHEIADLTGEHRAYLEGLRNQFFSRHTKDQIDDNQPQ